MKTRAAQLVELGRVECVEAEVEPLRDGDVLVRTRYASICGSDLHIVYDGIETAPPQWVPGYPGHEGVGEVLESRSDALQPGDLVLVSAGIYKEAVIVEKEGDFVIRGEDRNDVIVDGEFTRDNGIKIFSDGVAVENMTLRNHLGNGVFWTGEGLGIAWPGQDLALFAFAVLFLGSGLLAAWLVRRPAVEVAR